MRFDILTLFPDIIHNYCNESILKRAQKAGLIKIAVHNFRDYTKNKQRHVDDKPYGGGAGMVLQVQPIWDCLKAIRANKLVSRISNKQKVKIIILDPGGKKFDQRMAEKFSKLDRVVFICGRYEGFDERIYKLADERVSVGDYVLSGGELPALMVVEAVSRLIPSVLGNEESLLCETHSKVHSSQFTVHSKSRVGLRTERYELRTGRKYPVYTRPENFMGQKVPKILLSGDHKKIQEWRNRQVENLN